MRNRFMQSFLKSIFFLIVFCFTSSQMAVAAGSPSSSSSTGDVSVYDVFELNLTASGSYANPYLMMPGDSTSPGFVTAVFTAPNNTVIKVDGFWDGGNTWKIRMAPTMPGIWTYSTSSSDPGLNGKTGSFSAVVSSNKGFIKVNPARPHHFMWTDGTPFYFAPVATMIAHYDTGRDAQGDNRTVNDSTFNALMATRASQGFTVAYWGYFGFNKPQFNDGTQANEGGAPFTSYDPDQLNPSYYQYGDQRVQAAEDNGIAVMFTLGWPDQGILTTQATTAQAKRYWRYLIARYAAYNVIWQLFGEGDEIGGSFQSVMDDFGALTKTFDPYSHPFTTHLTSGPDATLANRSYFDYITLQTATGNTNNYLSYNKPVLNAEYGGYESFQTDGNGLRPMIWDVLMHGGYFTYESWGNDANSTGAAYASYANKFFRDRTNFSFLEYHPELFGNTPGLANPGSEYVTYLRSGGSVSVDLSSVSTTLSLEWFNPRTGTVSGQTTIDGGSTISLSAPDGNDWVLHLYGGSAISPVIDTATFDFTLSNGGDKTVTQGQSVTNTVTAALAAGTAQSTAFTVSGLPTGVSGSFSQSSCLPTCSTTLTISTLSTTAAGSYTVTITAVAGSVTKTSPFTLVVNSPSSPPATSSNPIDSLQPGHWYEVPNSNLRAVSPCPADNCSYSANGTSTIMDAWSGGAYDTKRDRLIVWGGGHGDYGGNEVYAFDVNTLKWSRVWGPSDAIPAPGGACSETYSDGNPTSRHTYDGLTYLPLQDRFFSAGGSLYCGSGAGSNGTWFFDFNTNRWERKADWVGNGVSEYSAYDPVTGHVFGGSDHNRFGEYDPVTDTWTELPGMGSVARGEQPSSVIDPVNRLFFTLDSGIASVYNLQTEKIFVPVFTGGSAITSMRGPALTFDSSINKIVGWAGGTSVYSLDPSSWTWTEHTAAPDNVVTPTAPTRVGVFGRFQYIPSKNVFILINSVDSNVFFYKLSSGTPIVSSTSFDFSLGNGGNKSATPGQSTSNSVTASLLSGTTQMTTFAVSGLPTGSIGTLSQLSCNPSCSTTLNIVTSSTTPPGNYTVTITAVAGSVTRTSSFTLTISAVTAPPPASTTLPPQINITPGIFYALDYPDDPPTGIRNSKHVTWAYNPINGRLYSMGGDFGNDAYPVGATTSYRQDMYSLSLYDRWTNRADHNAGWRQEYPYCAPTGAVMPKSPDFVGWTWDSKRNLFWMIPGTMVTPGQAVCPGRTTTRLTDDPQYKVGHIMTFNPFEPDLSKRWTDLGPSTRIDQAGEDWMSVYDPVTDTIIHFDNNEMVDIYDIKSNSWTSMHHASNALGNTVRIYDAALSPDFDKRVIYAVDQYSGRLMRWNMDAKTMSDLGPVPDGAFGNLDVNSSFTAWDSVNKVLFFFHPITNRLHIYHPDTGTWETPVITTDPPGLQPRVNHAIVFDPYQNVLAFLGNRDDTEPYDFIYRYKNGSASPSATPAPTLNLSANPTSVAAGSASTLTWTSTNATSCTASGGWSGTKATSGSESTVSLSVATSFTITCTGTGGSANQSVTVSVLSSPPASSASGSIINATPTDYASLLRTLKPGDTLVLAAGTYPGMSVYDLNGTPNSPVTITGPSSGSPAVILGSAGENTLRIQNSSYVIIKKLEVNPQNLGGDGVNGQTVSHDITLDNLYIHGCSDDQGTVGISTNRAETWNWVIRNTTITDCGTGMYLGNSDGNQQFLSGTIENNLIYDTIGYNIEIKQQNPLPTNITGLPLTTTKTIIRNNVFSKAHNASTGDMARPNLLVGHAPLSGPGQDNYYEIYGNFFYQNPSGEALFQGEGNYGFYDNILFNSVQPTGASAAILAQPHNDKPRDIRIFNNTVVAPVAGISVSGGYSTFRQQVVGNAVFSGNPIASADQQDNITDKYDSASAYLNNPFASLGSADFYPKVGMLSGTIINTSTFNNYSDWDKDFNGTQRANFTFRGAYFGEGSNPGWLPKLEEKVITATPSTSDAPPFAPTGLQVQ